MIFHVIKIGMSQCKHYKEIYKDCAWPFLGNCLQSAKNHSLNRANCWEIEIKNFKQGEFVERKISKNFYKVCITKEIITLMYSLLNDADKKKKL